jgi:hypothetical protein
MGDTGARNAAPASGGKVGLSRELAQMYTGLFDAFEAAATEQEAKLAGLCRAAAPCEADLLLLLCRGVVPLMRVPYADRGQAAAVTQAAQSGGIMLRALQRRLRATAEI